MLWTKFHPFLVIGAYCQVAVQTTPFIAANNFL